MKLNVLGKLAPLVPLVVIACSSLGPEEVAGVYTVRANLGFAQFIGNDGEVVDLVGPNGTVTILLNADGSMSSNYVLPKEGSTSDVVIFGTGGTWEVNGGVITINDDSDTFIAECEWTYSDDLLSCDLVLDFGEGRLTAELVRTE